MTDKPQFDGKKVKVKLADVCTLTMGQSPSSNSYNEIGNGIPFFQGNADFGEEAPVP
jgi:type I restriction enzyme S subunit